MRSPDGGPTGATVDPGWLLRAVLVTLAVALLCGYATFCLLFYQGQWQMVLHPTREKAEPRIAAGTGGGGGETPAMIRFAPGANGTPQMTGWWFPADPTGAYRHLTVLYLPSGNGQVANAGATLTGLHDLGLNVFAFDYRGFGQSAGGHPNEEQMTEDAKEALAYLGTIRNVPRSLTILYGAGVGGSLAVDLAASDARIPAVILDGPEPNLLATAMADPRSRILPVRLLFKERFPLFPALATLRTPKLILTRNSKENRRIVGDAGNDAADPKITVALPDATETIFRDAVSRFLDRFGPPTPMPRLEATPTGTTGR